MKKERLPTGLGEGEGLEERDGGTRALLGFFSPSMLP